MNLQEISRQLQPKILQLDRQMFVGVDKAASVIFDIEHSLKDE